MRRLPWFSRQWHFATLVVAGLCQAWSISWPFEFGPATGQPVWWFQILALAWLYRQLQAASTSRHAFQMAWVFATTWLAATFWWLFTAMHTYGGMPFALAALAVMLLASVLALYYGAAAAMAHGLRSEGSPTTRVSVFAATWLLAELCRGVLWTGFGWGAIGYAHVDGPLHMLAPLGGAYAMAFVSAWLSAALAESGWGSQWRMVAAALVASASFVPGLHSKWTAPVAASTVSLLQGNIAQDEKFMAGTGIPQALTWYADQLQHSQADIVIAPETAIPLLPAQLEPEYWNALEQHFAKGPSLGIIGIPLGSFEAGYTNSVLGLQPGREAPWRYDKHHLVPFGEFIPTGFRWFTRMMQIPLGDFARGPVAPPPIVWKGQRIAINICYEDLFGEELGARFIDPVQEPTIFANVSNIAWFGKSAAVDQHLHISRMRALEFERPFVRATNTGATVIINHQAQVQAALPYQTTGVLEGSVQGRTGVTPYAWWVSRWGLAPLWLFCAAVLLLAYGARRCLAG